mgnify:FL=1|tara:strand:- start:856 stop:1065 length:210 start_codon:yes stop_codon:yes gene_type:complete
MEFILFIYFAIVFLGLQALFVFEKNTSMAMVMIGNALILYHTIYHGMLDLLILTVMMTVAQLSRIYRGI